MLPVAVALFSSDGNAINYVLPVFWMTSCFRILDRMGQNQRQRACFVKFAKWRHRGRSLPSWLHVVLLLRSVREYVFYVFSKRQRITLRLLYAMSRPSVVCLSVCLSSVTLVHSTQAVELFGNFFSPYDSPGTLLFWCQKSLVGTPLSPWNLLTIYHLWRYSQGITPSEGVKMMNFR